MINRQERRGRNNFFKPAVFMVLVILGQTVLASGLGGFTGTSARFTADPLSAGTGGITLFENSSTNSYAQNPAAQAWLTERSFDAGMVQLSLDRYIYSVNGSVPLPPTAHLGFGLIAAGTRNIEARDSRGYYAGDLNDSEMTYLLSFSNRFSDKLAFGLSLKLLTKKFSSEEEDLLELKGSGFGAGLGLQVKPLPGSTFAFALKDWNSSYKWKTQELFERGSSYRDEFPLSIAWGWLQEMGSIALLVEHDHYLIGVNIYRAAIMWSELKNLDLNGGFSYEDETIIPGVSARYILNWKQGPPMHIDLGIRGGIEGEGLRNYLGWGVNF
ncbi:MAG: hypothetical protein U9Q77_12595 [Candidatus Marinimicrobia bacterium]|nr:hypothetical protein [Candidatus Neomarinimicrobiota bacterium]